MCKSYIIRPWKWKWEWKLLVENFDASKYGNNKFSEIRSAARHVSLYFPCTLYKWDKIYGQWFSTNGVSDFLDLNLCLCRGI